MQKTVKVPALDKFCEKILLYKGMKKEIEEMTNDITIGWLKINVKPIKSSLTVWYVLKLFELYSYDSVHFIILVRLHLHNVYF